MCGIFRTIWSYRLWPFPLHYVHVAETETNMHHIEIRSTAVTLNSYILDIRMLAWVAANLQASQLPCKLEIPISSYTALCGSTIRHGTDHTLMGTLQRLRVLGQAKQRISAQQHV